MSGDSGEVLESSAAAASAGEEEKDDKLEDSGERITGGSGGNRWPRPEALALLRIRSEMDSAFRDATLKAPLWEQISRKMAELGYRRSAKKCKEKFENVYKYHKRTKEGRSGKPEGKTYRFFEELEAFESLHSYPPKSQPTKLSATTTTTTITTTKTVACLVPWISSSNPSSGTNTSPLRHDVSVNRSSGTNPISFSKQQSTPIVMNHGTNTVLGAGYKTNSSNFTSAVSPLNLFSSSTSSSTASEEEEEDRRMPRKRKKYWKGLFKRLTKDLMEKQGEMQDKFLEKLDKREKERIEREEASRVQETERVNREYELLLHERSAAAAKDATIISFLQKISGQQQHQHQPPQQKQPQPQEPIQGDHISFDNDQKHEKRTMEATRKMSNGDSKYLLSPSSSRWPKAEVEALIRLRTNVGANYQENGTKGSLWEEISTGMRRLGYHRNAKRCKEKWENINKYFKKVKESNKNRPMDSKTCPYFHQLDAIYKEKNKTAALPLMVSPQQQLLTPQETRDEWQKQMANEGYRVGQEERDSEEEEEEEEEEQQEEEDNETGGFDIMLNNKTCSPMDINSNVFA